jgi:prolyl oligopeptidase
MRAMAWVLAMGMTGVAAEDTAAERDPYLWLEDVAGAKPLDWVRARNAESTGELAKGRAFEALREGILRALDSDAKIPYVAKIGDRYYNLWKDKEHARGLWRRTTLAEYRKPDPDWETVLDLDALGRAEHENWVWHGVTCLEPAYVKCMVSLSRGGADADVVREFDLATKAFVPGGFHLPESKNQVSWVDADTLFVGTNLGADATESGYPRVARLWKRGTRLEDAPVVFEGEATDVAVAAFRDNTPGFERTIHYRSITFYTNEIKVLVDGRPVTIDKPASANANLHREWLLLTLREDWTVGGRSYRAGSLLAAKLDDYLAGRRELDVLFEPTARSSLADYEPTRGHVIVNVLDNVRNRLHVLTPGERGWTSAPLPGVPAFGNVEVAAVDDDAGDDYWLTVTDFLTPTYLAHGTVGAGPPRTLKRLPAFFDAQGLAVAQHETTSKDGTKIPYFEVARANLRHDGRNPTLLYGYGGFESSELPNYSTARGLGWLEKGGVFVVANIRGGGEFGPRWHQAALKANRHKAYEDFAAVAEDLIRRKVTRPEHLGALGGSNGGLLIGNMLTRYPQLFGALVCQVPLLDMRRYHRLLAGASWMGEYGDPDRPEEWRFIETFSPYHRVEPGKDYPRVLFTTSTRDDRVHPGHARKMVAKMKHQGHDVLYYENIEGGHGGAADNKQQAFMWALAYTFLWKELAP